MPDVSSDLQQQQVVQGQSGYVQAGGVDQSSFGSTGQVQAVQGGNLTGARTVVAGIMQAHEANAKATEAVMGIVKGALDPMIKAEQQRQYLAGAQRVMAGESAKEIIDQQPWFSRIFGKDATAQGATAMGAMVSANQMASGMQADLKDPNIQALSPEQFRQHMLTKLQSARTGDDEIDTLTQQKFLENSDHLISQHGQLHYAYVQNGMKQQTEKLMATQSGLYSTTMTMTPPQLRTPERVQRMQQQLAETFVKQPGQSDESYRDGIVAAASGMASRGEFHALNVLMGSTAFRNLPEDLRARIANQRAAAEQKHANEIGESEYGWGKMVLFENLREGKIPGKTLTEQLRYMRDEADKMNVAYRTKYGMTRDFISEPELIKAAQTGMHDVWKSQEKLRLAELQGRLAGQAVAGALSAQEEVRERKIAEQVVRYRLGQGEDPYSTIPAEDKNVAFSQAFDSASRAAPNGGARMLVQNFAGQGPGQSYVNPAIRERWVTTVNAAAEGGYSSSTDQMLRQQVIPLLEQGPNGRAAAFAYLGGDERAAKVLKVAASIRDGNDGTAAWNGSMGIKDVNPRAGMSPAAAAAYDSNLRKRAKADVAANHPDVKEGSADWHRLVSQQLNGLNAAASHGLDIDAASAAATAGNGSESLFAGKATDRRPGQTTAANLMGLRPDLASAASRAVLRDKLMAQGHYSESDADALIDSGQIMRMDDQTIDGQLTPVFAFTSYNAAGGHPIFLQGNEIQARAKDDTLQKLVIQQQGARKLEAVNAAAFGTNPWGWVSGQ